MKQAATYIQKRHELWKHFAEEYDLLLTEKELGYIIQASVEIEEEYKNFREQYKIWDEVNKQIRQGWGELELNQDDKGVYIICNKVAFVPLLDAPADLVEKCPGALDKLNEILNANF